MSNDKEKRNMSHFDADAELNISNVNVKGEIMLNDSTLLELIAAYPLLYSPLTEDCNDPHYAEWAWKRITVDFNRSYNYNLHAVFSVDDLINRWKTLKCLVYYLYKDFDLSSLPQSLRIPIVKIGHNTEIENQGATSSVESENHAEMYSLNKTSKMAQSALEQQHIKIEQDLLNVLVDQKKNLALNDIETIVIDDSDSDSDMDNAASG